MCNLAEKTPTQLNAMTHSDVALVKDKDGNNVKMTETVRDALTGDLVSCKVIKWTYYPGGEVDKIIIEEGKQRRVIKHFRGRRQPEIQAPLGLGDIIFESVASGIGAGVSRIKGLLVEPVMTPSVIEKPIMGKPKKPWHERLAHTLWPPIMED